VLVPLLPAVVITGLNTRPELNNRVVRMTDFNPESSRFTVVPVHSQLNGQRARNLAVRLGNLRLPVGTVVVVRGLATAQEHNGSWGTVTEFDAGAGRYLVTLQTGRQLKVLPANVALH
jgi:hypothetical protein